jgi:hypothetical protein
MLLNERVWCRGYAEPARYRQRGIDRARASRRAPCSTYSSSFACVKRIAPQVLTQFLSNRCGGGRQGAVRTLNNKLKNKDKRHFMNRNIQVFRMLELAGVVIPGIVLSNSGAHLRD